MVHYVGSSVKYGRYPKPFGIAQGGFGTLTFRKIAVWTFTRNIGVTDSKREKLSSSWRDRFEILDQIDGDFFGRGKELTSKERNKLTFRPWAFLFQWIYYCVKGMWAKGLMLLMFAFVIDVPLAFLDYFVHFPLLVYSILVICIPGVVAATLATSDYYKKIVLGEEMWAVFSKLPVVATSIPVLIIICVALGSVSSMILFRHLPNLPSCSDEDVLDTVEQIFDRSTPSDEYLDDIDFIRLTNTDRKTKQRTCKAQVFSTNGEVYDITYTINHDDAGNYEYIVLLEQRYKIR